MISWKHPRLLQQEHRNYATLLGWFAVCWLQNAFILFKHLHKKCAVASSSNHQKSKGRSCSFSSGPFFPTSARWLSVLLLPGVSLFPVLLATNWSPAVFFPSFCFTLFLGLQCGPWDSFLLVTWSIQTAPIQGVLHISPAPLTPGLFSVPEHIWRCPTAQERLYSFPHLLLFWAQPLLIPRMAPTISFQLARIFSLSSSFHIPSQKTQLRFESDNSIHMSNQGR